MGHHQLEGSSRIFQPPSIISCEQSPCPCPGRPRPLQTGHSGGDGFSPCPCPSSPNETLQQSKAWGQLRPPLKPDPKEPRGASIPSIPGGRAPKPGQKPQRGAREQNLAIRTSSHLETNPQPQSAAAPGEPPATARLAAEKPGPGNLQVKGPPALSDRAVTIQMLP